MSRQGTVRVLLVDWAYRVRLLHATDPAAPDRGTWWELPRLDELGPAPVPGVRVGPCVWVRRTGGRLAPVERTHVAWVDQPGAPGGSRVAALPGDRWWTLDELAASDERFSPARLPALAGPVVRGEYGATPLDAGG